MGYFVCLIIATKNRGGIIIYLTMTTIYHTLLVINPWSVKTTQSNWRQIVGSDDNEKLVIFRSIDSELVSHNNQKQLNPLSWFEG